MRAVTFGLDTAIEKADARYHDLLDRFLSRDNDVITAERGRTDAMLARLTATAVTSTVPADYKPLNRRAPWSTKAADYERAQRLALDQDSKARASHWESKIAEIEHGDAVADGTYAMNPEDKGN